MSGWQVVSQGQPTGWSVVSRAAEPDKTKAAIAGVANAPAFLLGAAGDVATLATDAGQWVGNRIGDAVGLPQAEEGSTPPWRGAFQSIGSQSIRNAAGDALSAVGVSDEQNAFRYQPQTFGEKVAFAAGAGANSPLPIIGASGAVSSELAGQALKDTPLEMPARVAAGLVGGMGAGYLTGRIAPRTPNQVINEVTSGYTAQQFDDAARLQADAARMGVNLTGPEALQQVAGTQGRIGSVQYLAERSRGGAPVMEQFMSQRPQQLTAASDNALRMVGPDGLVPEQVAGRVQGAAVNAIGEAQRGVTKVTQPMYQQANATPISEATQGVLARRAQMSGQYATPDARAMLQKITADIESAPNVGAASGVIQQYRKAIETNALGEGVDRRTAAIVGEQLNFLEDKLKTASPMYERAQNTFAQLSQQNVTPLREGNIGRLAGDGEGINRVRADLTTQEAALLDPNVARPQTIRQDVATLSGQDATAPRDLLRIALENRRNASFSNTQGGANAMAGANFAKTLRGNPQARENLIAALESTGGKEAAQGFNRFLDVMEATGKRQGANSRTFELGQIQQDLTQPGIVESALRSPANLGGSINQMIDYARYGRNTRALAEAFTAPESVNLLRQMGRDGIKEAQIRRLAAALYSGGLAQGLSNESAR